MSRLSNEKITALLGKYAMVSLRHGAPPDDAEWERCTSKANCTDPGVNDWKADVVHMLISSGFAKRAPKDVIDYLNRRSWTNEMANKLMAWMFRNESTGEDDAHGFPRIQPDLWTQRVTPATAEKIRAAL